MNYKRLFVENSCLFITIVTYNRRKILIENIDILRQTFEKVKKIYPFDIIAITILFDHLHMIIKPEDTSIYPKIISSIKHSFSINVGQVCPTYDLKSGYKHKREKGIWQRRYYEHTIRNEEDLNKHIDYIHYNSFKHYNIIPSTWKYSTFEKYVKNDYYDKNWIVKDESIFKDIQVNDI